MSLARKKILAHLKKNRAISSREIARALKMTTPNVRHHLGVLKSDGRIEMVETRLRGGRGRSEKLYSLSQAALGDNIAALADALLKEAGSLLKVDVVANHILDAKQFENLPISKRLALLIEKLNGMHYQARWEAGAGGPRVIFGRCPYAKVIDENPALCKMDVAMLSAALGGGVGAVQKNEGQLRGVCPFIFQTQ